MRRIHTRLVLSVGLQLAAAASLRAQIRVSPTGVSTNAMAATTVFLTFGGLRNQVPVEGLWCGEVLPAVSPDRGTRCDPQTIYGRLPLRSDLTHTGANGALTDIMSIPASVTRRAYYAAFRGQSSTFFYVRRFASTVGGPDEYVAVTCRLTGGGANVPFSLTNVTVAFASKAPVQFVQVGETPPPLSATIQLNGSGQLRGRWEVVMPGEPLPSTDDLLTEATLAPELRTQQKHYALISRFNETVLPNQTMVLPGPDPSRLPHDVEGTYYVLLRIEATDDGAGDSNLGAVGADNLIVHNGAVAGFPMPMLRYVVGSAATSIEAAESDVDRERTLLLLSPRANGSVRADSTLTVEWTSTWGAAFYRVEFENAQGKSLLSAIVRKGKTSYTVPPMLSEDAAPASSAGNGSRDIRWRVVALDGLGAELRRTPWRHFKLLASRP